MKTMKKIITLSLAVLFFSALAMNTSFAGKPTGGGGGKKVAVESATPNTVVQTADADVTIRGSGFDNGSKVRFLVTGTTDDSQIEVGTAQFISSTELKVHIKTTGATATVDYDIEVQATSGRKGKGTTLFKVQQAETACTGYESKEPEIAFLSALDTSGDIHTQDLYLSSISGCDQYLLLADAVQKLPDGSPSEGPGEYLVNITDLRLDIEGGMGVVVWRDRSIDPIPQYALKFTLDSFGNVNPDPGGPEPVHIPAGGYGARGADVRISDFGEIELVMIERAPDDSEWRVSYVNVDSGSYLILSSGLCQVQDALGECFNPVYAHTWWNEDGSQIFFDTGNWPSGDRMAIARIQRINGQWQPAEILMTHYTSLVVIGLRSDGLLAYEREEYDVNKKRSKRRWVTASIFPEDCVDPEPECLPSDGTEMAVDGTKFPRGWTRNGGMLFIETGPGNQKNLREYSNPFNGSVGRLDLRDVDRDQRDTTY